MPDDPASSEGAWAVQREGELPTSRTDALIRRSLELGLEAAPSIKDRTISLFSRGELPHFAGINTFLKVPYLEDMRPVGNYDVAISFATLDTAPTFLPSPPLPAQPPLPA